jgi:hypothetical protein
MCAVHIDFFFVQYRNTHVIIGAAIIRTNEDNRPLYPLCHLIIGAYCDPKMRKFKNKILHVLIWLIA